mmetsp:Transcript_83568/g.147778  ORF Transcript_83568/g.147778 Transcript_83568/m.147778 type:complete len:224 (+) Transcript_83568:81-752(+)
MLYLAQVLNDIKKESSPPKTLRAEHLFKLNEAVFNLSEEDAVDGPLALRLFQAVEKINIAYHTGKYDNTDSNFFYDYLALLGTMQNQHFFSQKQTEKMLGWIKEVVDGSEMTAETGGSKALESENAKLKKKLEKYEGAAAKAKAKPAPVEEPAKSKKGKKAKEVIPEPVKQEPKGKSKAKGKGKAPVEEEPPKKGKGKGKGKAEKEEPPSAKGKGKGKGGKGK